MTRTCVSSALFLIIYSIIPVSKNALPLFFLAITSVTRVPRRIAKTVTLKIVNYANPLLTYSKIPVSKTVPQPISPIRTNASLVPLKTARYVTLKIVNNVLFLLNYFKTNVWTTVLPTFSMLMGYVNLAGPAIAPPAPKKSAYSATKPFIYTKKSAFRPVRHRPSPRKASVNPVLLRTVTLVMRRSAFSAKRVSS